MTRLIVAAGGGGDAVGAALLHSALYGDDDPAVILTYAWDRLLIDPLPGPRNPADFTGLEPLTRTTSGVPATARPLPPAGSTLPRLAAHLPHRLALIDPRHGVRGITDQLDDLVAHLRPTSVDLLDIGGDILARGDEPTLKSPLADALTLAACAQLDADVRLLIAGPGLDGELPYDAELRDLLGPRVHTFTACDVEPISAVLEWHPSEATGMLAATARGVRGICEIRDAGLPVPLTDDSPVVHEADLDQVLDRNELARAVVSTSTLPQAEALSRRICGFSEIDYERTKAHRLGQRQPGPLDPVSALHHLTRFETAARARGVTHTTFRRLTEALNLSGTEREPLRRLLADSYPQRYRSAAPLWSLTPVSPPFPHSPPQRKRPPAAAT
ncbi:DUF1152 domain-containing protein [Streptomyces sp. NPDC086091]|uniref:DUF1152 domain-containing protein n=1 Tax=Streptomyces sp. NPDC086091 TaxID=3365751 RepID=UPI00382B527D